MGKESETVRILVQDEDSITIGTVLYRDTEKVTYSEIMVQYQGAVSTRTEYLEEYRTADVQIMNGSKLLGHLNRRGLVTSGIGSALASVMMANAAHVVWQGFVKDDYPIAQLRVEWRRSEEMNA